MPKLLLKVCEVPAVFLNISEGYKVWGLDLSIILFLVNELGQQKLLT